MAQRVDARDGRVLAIYEDGDPVIFEYRWPVGEVHEWLLARI